MTDVMQESDFNQTYRPKRNFKRTSSGHLISADYRTPQADQLYGYVLEPLGAVLTDVQPPSLVWCPDCRTDHAVTGTSKFTDFDGSSASSVKLDCGHWIIT